MAKKKKKKTGWAIALAAALPLLLLGGNKLMGGSLGNLFGGGGGQRGGGRPQPQRRQRPDAQAEEQAHPTPMEEDFQNTAPQEDGTPQAPTGFQPYSKDLVSKLQDQGKPYMFTLSADWCPTCKDNEKVFNDPDVQKRMEDQGVTMIKADLSDRTPENMRLMQEVGQGSVPNSFFFNGQQETKLPTNLDKGTMTDLKTDLRRADPNAVPAEAERIENLPIEGDLTAPDKMYFKNVVDNQALAPEETPMQLLQQMTAPEIDPMRDDDAVNEMMKHFNF